MTLLIDVLRRHLADRPDIFIGGNLALYYSHLQARNNDFRAPDYMVVRDAIPDRERKSWVVWEEASRTPDLIIELLSPSTEREDRGRKKKIYASLNVSEYFLYDIETERLEGFRLHDRQLIPFAPRPDGDFESQVLGLRLGVADGLYQGHEGRWLRWKTMDGVPLPTGDENEAVAQARADEEKARADEQQARADEQQARADEQQARADAMEARLRALGIDPKA